MTDEIDELMRLIKGDDGLLDPIGDAQTARLYGWGAFIPGVHSDTEHREDLLVVIHTDGWALFWRDAEGADYHWGRTWNGGEVHSNWDLLVNAVYSL